jgi:hypothetical protein
MNSLRMVVLLLCAWSLPASGFEGRGVRSGQMDRLQKRVQDDRKADLPDFNKRLHSRARAPAPAMALAGELRIAKPRPQNNT